MRRSFSIAAAALAACITCVSPQLRGADSALESAYAVAAANSGQSASTTSPVAKNVIIMISDGTGYDHIAASDLYELGPGGTQVYERFPFRYAMSTYSASGNGYDPAKAWASFDYVLQAPTDSAAAATAMSTGHKTFDGAVGVRGSKSAPIRVEHLVERAEKAHKSTGVVTSVQWSHGTPAGFSAHNVSRDNYTQIASEMVTKSRLDVIMGAGHPFYDNNGKSHSTATTYKYVGGKTLWFAIAAGKAGGDADADGDVDRWTPVRSLSEFRALQFDATPPKRVLGTARVGTTLNEERSGDRLAAPFAVPMNTGVPTLAEMSKGALNVLDQDADGFVLMIEGGAVDWAAHANRKGRMIEEHMAFDDAVSAVCEWVEVSSSWDDTLLIVTGDHETGYLTGPGSGTIGGLPVWKPLTFAGIGVQPGMSWHTVNHTNSLVPIYVKGRSVRSLTRYADRRDPVRGRFLDNTDIRKFVDLAVW